eukprot:10397944-Prorocentrum_lima.AAC.1
MVPSGPVAFWQRLPKRYFQIYDRGKIGSTIGGSTMPRGGLRFPDSIFLGVGSNDDPAGGR